jgi:hypothetical protein
MMTTTKRTNLLTTAQDAAKASLVAIHEAFLSRTTGKPKQGRPVKRNFEDVASSIGWLQAMEDVVRENALVSYLAHAMLRRDLTEEERTEVKESPEGIAQGVLPCGDPAQSELFIQTHCRVLTDDEDGAQFLTEVERVASMAQDVAFREKADLYVRFVPNVVIREKKGAGRHALRARYGGRFYISNRSDHAGLLLYIVQGTDLHPQTRRGVLQAQVAGLPESAE